MSYEGFSFFVNAMGAMLVVAGVLILIVSTRSKIGRAHV